MSDLMETLRQEGISPDLLRAVWKNTAPPKVACPRPLRPRIPVSGFTYYGREVWEQAPSGPCSVCRRNSRWPAARPPAKCAGWKIWPPPGRPAWDISVPCEHGMQPPSSAGDTFVDGRSPSGPGRSGSCCAQCGGSALDEDQHGRNEALAVLHAVLDFACAIDVLRPASYPAGRRDPLHRHHELWLRGHLELNEAPDFLLCSHPDAHHHGRKTFESCCGPSLPT